MPGSHRPADDRATDGRRGQTTLDFVLAIGVFIVAVAFVFGFVPGMVDPFTQDQAEGQVADRVADAVVDDLTDGVDEPGELNETKTVAFFDGPADLADRAGVDSRYGITVSLGRPVDGEDDLQVLCGESGDVHSCSAGGEALQIGDSVPASSTTIGTARRTVLVDDQIAIVHVQVWS
ncbi:putative pilin/flagellin [Halanaeroarchaeum sp. HSR-CO]|uniref:DUF7287 family protein n=1 Tax=Halanaeroarchaeum sp. HSR-CO TaxID=2866382 RepID=UPI00217D2554|nr:hypothetical protein [Halanaeroarchaeum sp. HSR-CO]UWG46979.1 putative pilin/flagellin [Halanaeroarchaeum sp. HSR-CO]